MLVSTCLKCRHVTWTTRKQDTCIKCGGPTHNETTEERDKRLGIKHSDIRSWNIDNQLKGLSV